MILKFNNEEEVSFPPVVGNGLADHGHPGRLGHPSLSVAWKRREVHGQGPTDGRRLQPPTSTPSDAPLRIRLERLRAAAQAGPTSPRVPSHQAKLHAQLVDWLASMTPDQRRRRFTLDEVERLAGLIGKRGGRAAHHHIAQVLRRLGFAHRRDWSAAGRNRRFWQFERS